jgi:four helix bundle protein
MDIVTDVYNLTSKFPASEQFGLTSQMRRAAVSIPSNIAEGKHRGTRKDYRQFLLIAFGSIAELETQLEISKRLKYINPDGYEDMLIRLQELSRMQNRLIDSLSKKPST